MGAYSPLYWAPDEIVERTLKEVLDPTIQEMAARNTPFIGLLYAGLALTDNGIRVIEFNARFGDPETQVLLPRLKTPLAQLLFAAATGQLADFPKLEWDERVAVGVVLASEGYPAEPIVDLEITGVEKALHKDARLFIAGAREENGSLKSSGGRVLTCTGLGSDLTQARDRAYLALSKISLEGSHHRKDIALNASIAEKGE
jgi:phosphoribosylamine--glycine ligase